MVKIKDRNTLAIVSGLIGMAGTTLVDGVSRRMNISKRSYREAAAGMFVSKGETRNWRGQILGVIMSSAVGMLGARYIVNELSRTGRDKLVPKGIFAGITIGAIATVIPNIIPNRVRPKDAASNLSYVVTNVIFGLMATIAAAMLGDNSLFDTPPQNDYLQPFEQTTEQKLAQSGRTVDHPLSARRPVPARPGIPGQNADETSSLVQ